MGAMMSCVNCAPMRVLAGDMDLTDDGMQLSVEAQRREHDERERTILAEISKREAHVADMRMEMTHHQNTAIACNRALQTSAPRSRAYVAAAGTARRELMFAQQLQQQIDRQMVLIGRAKTLIRQVQTVANSAADRKLIKALNEHANAVNIDLHTSNIEHTAEQLDELDDKSKTLRDLDEELQVSYTATPQEGDDMQFTLGDHDYALGVDSDLIAALSAMEERQSVAEPVAVLAASTTENFSMPATPATPPVLTKRMEKRSVDVEFSSVF